MKWNQRQTLARKLAKRGRPIELAVQHRPASAVLASQVERRICEAVGTEDRAEAKAICARDGLKVVTVASTANIGRELVIDGRRVSRFAVLDATRVLVWGYEVERDGWPWWWPLAAGAVVEVVALAWWLL